MPQPASKLRTACAKKVTRLEDRLLRAEIAGIAINTIARP